MKAVNKDKGMSLKRLLNVIRVAASDDNKRCAQVWKELSQ